MQFESLLNENSYEIEIENESQAALLNGKTVDFEYLEQPHGRKLLRIGTRLYRIDNAVVNGQNVQFSINGRWFSVVVKNGQELLLERLGFKSHHAQSVGSLQAPMPGKILNLLVSENDEVELGQPVVILEAMKMENELKAPCSGQVTRIFISVSDSVEKNQPIIEIEPRG
ncbi:MAG: biotin/lipoyl-containing protein [Balneolaceae bacterium]